MAIRTLVHYPFSECISITQTEATWPDGEKSYHWDMYCELCDDFIVLDTKEEAEQEAINHQHTREA